MPGTHAKYSPSAATRWMTCPGSIALSDLVPEVPSPYAEAGTRAHEVAEAVLRAQPADRAGILADAPDVADAVGVYCRRVLTDVAKLQGTLHVEERLKYNADCWGTADALLVTGDAGYLYDYKHGAGVWVAADSAQMKTYAVMAAMEYKLSTVVCTVVQPNHPDGPPVRSVTLADVDIREWKYRLQKALQDRTGNLATGEHCRFCRAKPKCPALHAQTQALARQDFSDPPAPALLSQNQVDAVITHGDILVDWIRSVQSFELQRLQDGGASVVAQVVDGRKGPRKWAESDTEMEKTLLTKGLEPDQIYTEKLKSPTQLEKIIGKDKMAHLTDYVIRSDGKPKLEIISSSSSSSSAKALSAKSDFTD